MQSFPRFKSFDAPILICLLIFSILACSLQQASAVPAFPGAVEVTQPDGTVFSMKRQGDEYFTWDETDEGYAVLKDPVDQFWKYARPARDRAAFEIIPNARVGVANPKALGLQKGAMPNRNLIRSRYQQGAEQVKGTSRPASASSPSSASTGPSRPASEPASAETIEDRPPSQIPVSQPGTIKNIVILAAFNDHWNSGMGTVSSTYGRVATSEYTNLFNETNHTNDGAVGSVRDYYYETSYGKLTVQSVVTPWVQLPQNESYYGTDGGTLDLNWRQMITDAINAADTAGFDFSQGDSDGDGWVDCVTVIHSGFGQEYTGNPSTCIWSKQGSLTSVVTKDGVNMLRCHTEPALRGGSGTSIIRIGVICHEMGHFFGLPDLYDYSNQTYGVGCWGIMASGSWNGSDGKRPAHFTAWSKYMLGFVKPDTIHSMSSVSIARAEDNAVVHLFRDGMSNGEYFLLENRARYGFDNDANIYPGLLIYHIDSKSTNNDLNTWPHPAVKIEEADGNNSLGGKTAYSQAGDVWTSISGLSGGFRDQTTNQSTNAMRYQAAHVYNRTDTSTDYSYIRLNTFSAAATTMTYTAATLRPAVASQTITSSNYTVSWGASSNATLYEIQEGSPVTLTSFSDGAESEEDMYENWALSGSVQRDNGGAQAGSYSYAMHQYYNSKWYSSVQSITQKNSFKVTTSTSISFYILSHLAAGAGYLKCQISKDAGATWITLGSYDNYVDSWSQKTFNYSALNAQGINANDMCILRFVANFEWCYGWAGFPGFGYAIDTISITNTEIASHGNWATLNNSVATNSYGISGKSNGTYSYKVRAYANSAWQIYGSVGTTTVNLPFRTVNFQTDGTIGTSLSGTLSQTVAVNGNTTPVTANAPVNYHLAEWTKGGTFYSNSNPLVIFNVTEDMTLTAGFAHDTGSLTVNINPIPAQTAGARWRRVGTSTWYSSGYTETGISTGSCTVEFLTIAGWVKPANQSVMINYNATTMAIGDYTVATSAKGWERY